MRRELLELLFPSGCRLCGLPLIPGSLDHYGLCDSCRDSLPRPSGRICEICGKPLISEKATCMRCRETRYSFVHNRSAFLYLESARRVIGAYKFNQEIELCHFLTKSMHQSMDIVDKPDYIVPVPPEKRKEKKRGWDPVRLLARGLAVEGVPILDVLGKKKGKDQKSLDMAGRSANIRGRFFLKRRIPEGKDYLVVDDVFTTGATVSECARVLRENGAGNVYSLTLSLDP